MTPFSEFDISGPGTFQAELGREPRYYSAIRSALKANKFERFVLADLIPEDHLADGTNAVRVEISGYIVGRLNREAVTLYFELLRRAGKPRVVSKCMARIVGGTAAKPQLEIWLDLPLER